MHILLYCGFLEVICWCILLFGVYNLGSKNLACVKEMTNMRYAHMCACIHCSSYKTAIKRFVLQFWVQFLDVSLLVSPKIDLPKRSFPTLNRRRDRFSSLSTFCPQNFCTLRGYFCASRENCIFWEWREQLIKWSGELGRIPQNFQRELISIPFSAFLIFRANRLMHTINN